MTTREGSGILRPRRRRGVERCDRAFVAAMRELGYVEGRNIAIDYRFAAGDAQRLALMVDELVALEPDAIVAAGPTVRVVAKATPRIPIVAVVADPVGQGLAESLGRPRGNLTGITLQSSELAHKRLQLLRELVPGLRKVAVLAFSTGTAGDPGRRDASVVLAAEVESAGKRAGIDTVVELLTGPSELGRAFARFRRERSQALIVQVAPLTYDYRDMIFALAAEARLPALYEIRNFVDEGGLVSYGPDLADVYRRVAGYVDRILRGAKPGELAIEQPGRFELVVNLKTAAELRLAVPQSLMLRADDVIR